MPRPARATLLVIAAICLVQIAVSAWRTRHAWFVVDDFLNFILYREMGLSFAYLFIDLFGHVTPLYRLVQAIVFEAFGLDFAAVRAITVAMALIPTVLLVLIGNRLGVPLALSGAAALLLAVQPQTGHAELWWANALLVLPGLAATFLCLWLLVGSSGTGPSDDEAALAGIVFAAGIGFYDKTLFAPVLFFGLLVALDSREGSLLAATRRALSSLRWVIVVAVLWLGFLLWVRDPSPPAPPAAVALRFAWLAWGDATVGALFGLDNAAVPLALAQIILLTLVGWTLLRTGRRAAIIWTAVAIYSLVTIALTARMRAGDYGAAFGRSLRYAAEPAAFIVFATLVGFGTGGSRRLWIATTAGLGLATNVVLTATIPPLGDAPATRTYVETLRKSLRQIAGEPGVVIADLPVPGLIMPGWMAPLNVASKFVPLVTRRQVVFADRSQATWMIEADGALKKLQ